MTDPHPLLYGAPVARRRHTALAVVAFALAVVAAIVPPGILVAVWQARRSGVILFEIDISPGFYAVPAVAIVLAMLALRRGASRWFPVIAIVLAITATVAVLCICGRFF
jgi:hypothetical protein